MHHPQRKKRQQNCQPVVDIATFIVVGKSRAPTALRSTQEPRWKRVLRTSIKLRISRVRREWARFGNIYDRARRRQLRLLDGYEQEILTANSSLPSLFEFPLWISSCVITRLWIFMQIHFFFQNVVKKLQMRYKIVSPTKYYRKHLGISRIYFHIMWILCNFALSNLS